MGDPQDAADLTMLLKAHDVASELLEALRKLHSWGLPFIENTPISAETLWREFPAAMKHAGEVISKAVGTR